SRVLLRNSVGNNVGECRGSFQGNPKQAGVESSHTFRQSPCGISRDFMGSIPARGTVYKLSNRGLLKSLMTWAIPLSFLPFHTLHLFPGLRRLAASQPRLATFLTL